MLGIKDMFLASEEKVQAYRNCTISNSNCLHQIHRSHKNMTK